MWLEIEVTTIGGVLQVSGRGSRGERPSAQIDMRQVLADASRGSLTRQVLADAPVPQAEGRHQARRSAGTLLAAREYMAHDVLYDDERRGVVRCGLRTMTLEAKEAHQWEG